MQKIVIREFKDMGGLFPSQVPVRIWEFLIDAKTRRKPFRGGIKMGDFILANPSKSMSRQPGDARICAKQ